MEVVEVFPNIWLGNSSSASSRTFLKSKKIQLSINCSQNLDTPEIEGIKTFRLKALDTETMAVSIPTVTNLMGKAFQQLIPILIWCESGCQTSASLVAAFYIRFTGTPWSTTVRMIQTKYPNAFRPQISYLTCLTSLEEQYKPDNHDIL
jgi:hypothetical protein